MRRLRVWPTGFFSVTRTPHGEQVQIFCRRFPCTPYYVGEFTHWSIHSHITCASMRECPHTSTHACTHAWHGAQQSRSHNTHFMYAMLSRWTPAHMWAECAWGAPKLTRGNRMELICVAVHDLCPPLYGTQHKGHKKCSTFMSHASDPVTGFLNDSVNEQKNRLHKNLQFVAG